MGEEAEDFLSPGMGIYTILGNSDMTWVGFTVTIHEHTPSESRQRLHRGRLG